MAQDIIPSGSFQPAISGLPFRREEEGIGWKAARQLFFVIFKWQRLIFGLCLSFALAATVAMFIKPPIRSASARILMKGDRVTLQISGYSTSVGGKGLPVQVMQSEIQLIKSREVLLPVAKKLLTQGGKSEKDLTPEEIDGMLYGLSKNTYAVALPDTSVIEVTYFAPTSERAEKVLRLIIDEYLDRQAAIQSGSGKLLTFYEQEKDRVAAEMQTAENALNKWQEEKNVVSMDRQISENLITLSSRERSLQSAEAEIEATKAKITTMRKQLSGLPERMVRGRESVKNPLISKLKSDLVTAEVALQDLLQRYTEKDRRVQEKRAQIAMLNKELEAAEKEGSIVGREVTDLNPLRENLQRDLATAQAYLTSKVSEAGTLRTQVRDASRALDPLRKSRLEGERLASALALHKEAFTLYSKKLEEARIASGLGKEQLANVALIEKPHGTEGSDILKRIAMVVFAAIVGIALGMAIAFGVEFMSNSIRTQDDVEHYLGLPVLATVPELHNRPGPAGLLTSA